MEFYLTKLANWVRALYPHKARRVSCHPVRPLVAFCSQTEFQLLLSEREGGKRGYSEDGAEPLLSRLQQTGILYCLQGLKSALQYNEEDNGIQKIVNSNRGSCYRDVEVHELFPFFITRGGIVKQGIACFTDAKCEYDPAAVVSSSHHTTCPNCLSIL